MNKYILKIKKTFIWHLLRKLKKKYEKWVQENNKLSIFNGKILTSEIQIEMRNIIKKQKSIYSSSESKAKKLSDNWNVKLNKLDNLCIIEDSIPIVISANEKYAPYAAIMIQSILDNVNKSRKYHFLILESDFSNKTKEYFIDQLSGFSNCFIDLINTSNILGEIPIIISKSHFSLDIFSRYLIPYLFDKYPKVIYCDTDMFVKADIAQLYDINIQNYCLGAATNQWMAEVIKNRKYSSLISLSVLTLLENWNLYLNSGLLVFNTKLFNNNFSFQEFFKTAIYYTNRYKRIFDQDILSLLVKDNYFILPPEWNYCWAVSPNDNGISFRISNHDTKIIHFTSDIKPWSNHSNILGNPDAVFYKEYSKKVPLFNQYLKK